MMQRIAVAYIRSQLLGLAEGNKQFPAPITASKDGKQWVDTSCDDGFSDLGVAPVAPLDNKDVSALIGALALIEKGERVV